MDEQQVIKSTMENVHAAFLKLRFDKTALTDMGFDSAHSLRRFPFGCCSDASVVLKAILEQKGISGITICKAIYADDTTHFWLKWSGYHIDITCEQEPAIKLGQLIFSQDHPLFNGKAEQEQPVRFCEFEILKMSAEDESYFSLLIKSIQSFMC